MRAVVNRTTSNSSSLAMTRNVTTTTSDPPQFESTDIPTSIPDTYHKDKLDTRAIVILVLVGVAVLTAIAFLLYRFLWFPRQLRKKRVDVERDASTAEEIEMPSLRLPPSPFPMPPPPVVGFQWRGRMGINSAQADAFVIGDDDSNEEKK